MFRRLTESHPGHKGEWFGRGRLEKDVGNGNGNARTGLPHLQVRNAIHSQYHSRSSESLYQRTLPRTLNIGTEALWKYQESLIALMGALGLGRTT